MSTIELPAVTRDAIALNLVADELRKARGLHAPLNSAHEAYSVILEEVEEFWHEVRRKRSLRDLDNMRTELVQIAAMACRAISDLKLADTSGE